MASMNLNELLELLKKNKVEIPPELELLAKEGKVVAATVVGASIHGGAPPPDLMEVLAVSQLLGSGEPHAKALTLLGKGLTELAAEIAINYRALAMVRIDEQQTRLIHGALHDYLPRVQMLVDQVAALMPCQQDEDEQRDGLAHKLN